MSGDSPARPRAPERGLAARILGRFHVTGMFWYRFHQWGVVVAPRWVFAPGIQLFTAFFFLFLRRIRKAIAGNLVAVLGPSGWLETQKRIHRTLWTFSWCLTERYERLCVDRPVEIETRNEDAWHEVTAENQGVVLVTAHVGNWEIGAGMPSRREQRRVHLVREEELDPRAQELVRKLLRERMGELITTHFATDDPLLGVHMIEALGRGEIVALQADRPRTGGRTVRVELFGRPFELPLGPMALARAAGVPLLPVFVLRLGRLRYRVCFREPIRVHRTHDRRADREQAARELALSIEWAIREAPQQWFCFRELWDASGNLVDTSKGGTRRQDSQRVGASST